METETLGGNTFISHNKLRWGSRLLSTILSIGEDHGNRRVVLWNQLVAAVFVKGETLG